MIDWPKYYKQREYSLHAELHKADVERREKAQEQAERERKIKSVYGEHYGKLE